MKGKSLGELKTYRPQRKMNYKNKTTILQLLKIQTIIFYFTLKFA
jgi:hypothetical protein